MKLKYQFIITEIDDQQIAMPVDVDSCPLKGFIRLNDTAKVLMELLMEETTEEAIVEKLISVYDQSTKEQIAAYVHDFAQALKKAGVLK